MRKEEAGFAPTVVFEGMVSVDAVIKRAERTGGRKIERVFYDGARAEKLSRTVKYLKHRASELGFSLEEASGEYIDSICTGSSHGGIAAVCTERVLPPLSLCEPSPDGFFVMVEGIEDPYNFGYCLRSIYAAGADGIVLSPRNWLSAAGVVCRASAGASELFDAFEATGEEAAEFFRSRGYSIVCADTCEGAVSVYGAKLKKPLFLVVGGEKRGISKAVLDACDKKIRLEYGREFDNSLSAASAASIIAFEILRQNLPGEKA